MNTNRALGRFGRIRLHLAEWILRWLSHCAASVSVCNFAASFLPDCRQATFDRIVRRRARFRVPVVVSCFDDARFVIITIIFLAGRLLARYWLSNRKS